jgi:hypothetical protein
VHVCRLCSLVVGCSSAVVGSHSDSNRFESTIAASDHAVRPSAIRHPHDVMSSNFTNGGMTSQTNGQTTFHTANNSLSNLAPPPTTMSSAQQQRLAAYQQQQMQQQQQNQLYAQIQQHQQYGGSYAPNQGMSSGGSSSSPGLDTGSGGASLSLNTLNQAQQQFMHSNPSVMNTQFMTPTSYMQSSGLVPPQYQHLYTQPQLSPSYPPSMLNTTSPYGAPPASFYSNVGLSPLNSLPLNPSLGLNSLAVAVPRAKPEPLKVEPQARKRKKVGGSSKSRVDADAKATRIRKHNEAEVRRRQRLKCLLTELSDVTECGKTHKSAILRAAIERVRILTDKLRSFGVNVSELMATAEQHAKDEDDEDEEEEEPQSKRTTRGSSNKKKKEDEGEAEAEEDEEDEASSTVKMERMDLTAASVSAAAALTAAAGGVAPTLLSARSSQSGVSESSREPSPAVIPNGHLAKKPRISDVVTPRHFRARHSRRPCPPPAHHRIRHTLTLRPRRACSRWHYTVEPCLCSASTIIPCSTRRTPPWTSSIMLETYSIATKPSRGSPVILVRC